jgi:hypothetical protein
MNAAIFAPLQPVKDEALTALFEDPARTAQ